MISYERFSEIVDEEMELLPEYVFEELNGGVLVDKKANLHPKRLADDLYIMGTYSTHPIMGKQIVIYYGSFAATMGLHDEDTIRTKIRDTLRHEFRHHMETRAGFFGKGTLIDEDKQEMDRYYAMHRMREEQEAERERREKERLERERLEKERLERERLKQESQGEELSERSRPDGGTDKGQNVQEKNGGEIIKDTTKEKPASDQEKNTASENVGTSYGEDYSWKYLGKSTAGETISEEEVKEEQGSVTKDKKTPGDSGFTDTGYRGIKSVVLVK